MFKDEAGGKQIVECVGLRAKHYSYKMLDGSKDKKNFAAGDKECYRKEYSIRWLSRVLVYQEGTTSKNECHTKSLSWNLNRRN